VVNDVFSKGVKVNTAIIRKDRIFILAEVAQSYEGIIETLLEISSRACQSGVDGVMFQVVFADELAVEDYVHYDLFKSLEMPKKNWKQVIDIIHGQNKLALGEVFGKRSAELMLELGADAFKIHASDLSNIPFLKEIGKSNKPILLSVGGALMEEIEEAVKILKKNGVPELVLLHGYQLCPTEISDTRFSKMKLIIDTFQLPIGYSDHIAGCVDSKVSCPNELAYYLPLIAVGAGAQLIEKHIILDRSKAWEDYESALSCDEFQKFVNLIRAFEQCQGLPNFELCQSEKMYRKNTKKCIVASKIIPDGTILTEDCITFKRIEKPEEGITNINSVIGRKTAEKIQIDDPITKFKFR